jgi:hypothetical protein
VFWLSRPPYVRWALAAVVVVIGFVMEITPESATRHPFAVADLAVGDTIDDTVVIWRDVPRGLLEPVVLPTVASRRLQVGDPVLLGDASSANSSGIPDGWWGVEVDLPRGARPAMSVKLVTGTAAVDGIVIDVTDGDFGERKGLVAVPGDAAESVAGAALDAAVMVLLGG